MQTKNTKDGRQPLYGSALYEAQQMRLAAEAAAKSAPQSQIKGSKRLSDGSVLVPAVIVDDSDIPPAQEPCKQYEREYDHARGGAQAGTRLSCFINGRVVDEEAYTRAMAQRQQR